MEGVLIGANGLLKQLTKRLVERALEAEMAEQLGHGKHQPVANPAGNARNGNSRKTLKGDFGELPIVIPRDRQGRFEPQLIPKHQTRWAGFDDKSVSLYACGMTALMRCGGIASASLLGLSYGVRRLESPMVSIREKDADYGVEPSPAEAGRKVSARLGAEAAGNLQALAKIWDASITEVLTRALAEAAERALPKAPQKPNAYEMLLASGFIGSGSHDAPADLSANYKRYLSESLKAKHGPNAAH